MRACGKCFQCPITGSQIHADDLDQVLAFQPAEIAFQGGFAAAQHDIVHFIVLQIAESGGVAVSACEEVLVDAEDPRAFRADPFARQQPEVPEEPAFDGGA